MSIYSDHKCGALSDEEFRQLAAIEDRRERYYEMQDIERELWHDDDEVDDEYDECD